MVFHNRIGYFFKINLGDAYARTYARTTLNGSVRTSTGWLPCLLKTSSQRFAWWIFSVHNKIFQWMQLWHCQKF